MCSNHEMSVLFSAGVDGSIVFMQVVDKDPRKLGLSVQSIQQSSPILIKKSVRDLRLRETKELRESIAQTKD